MRCKRNFPRKSPVIAALRMDKLENYAKAGTLPREEFLVKMKDLFKQCISLIPEWSGSFDQLLTDGFDDDQIWAAISVTNNELFSFFESRLLLGEVQVENDYVEEDAICCGSVSENESDQVEQFSQSADEDFQEMDPQLSDLEGDWNEEEDDEDDEENEYEDEENVEMDDVDEELDDVDEEMDKEDDGQDLDISNVKYGDFFEGEPQEVDFEDYDENTENNIQDSKKPRKLDLDSDEEQNPSSLSTFEKSQQKLKKEISQLEMENASTEKPWTLQGEITATGRPLDSLLDVELDFENNAKPVPVITQEYCDNLDELIIQRIKDGMFDDVERRKPPSLSTQTNLTGTDGLVELVSEKSTKGLAQVYEEQYLNNTNSKLQSNSDKPEHLEIKNLFSNLMNKLDALSNYHFTPKIPKQEIQIVSNVAAIAVEEAIPVAVSGESMVTPVEVYQGQTPMAYSEYSKSKKRRIAKASARRKHATTNEKSSDKQKAIKQLSKQRNVIVKSKSTSNNKHTTRESKHN